MSISAASHAAIVNQSKYDPELASLYNLSYQTLTSESNLSTSCMNLPAVRMTLAKSFYYERVKNRNASASLIAALYSLVVPTDYRSFSRFTQTELVAIALEIELGIRNAKGVIVNGTARQTPYGCVGVVIEALNVSSGTFKYRLRTEYDASLDPSQGNFLDQSSAALPPFHILISCISKSILI